MKKNLSVKEYYRLINKSRELKLIDKGVGDMTTFGITYGVTPKRIQKLVKEKTGKTVSLRACKRFIKLEESIDA